MKLAGAMAIARRSMLAAPPTAVATRAGFLHLPHLFTVLLEAVILGMMQVREVKKSGTRQQWRKTEKPRPRPEQIPELGVPLRARSGGPERPTPGSGASTPGSGATSSGVRRPELARSLPGA